MKLIDLIAQLNASAELSDEENPEVFVANTMEGDATDIFEVSYNSHTKTIDVLTYDRGWA